MNRLTTTLLIFLTLIIGCIKDQNKSLTIKNLKVEYYTNPIAVDTEIPRFSWQLTDTIRSVSQLEYQILVASSPRNLTEKRADIWNSGWVKSDNSIFISYEGIPLESGKLYHWTVLIKDNNNRLAKAKESAFFRMAKLEKEDWSAEWISFTPDSAKDIYNKPRSVLMRKEFNVQGKIETALLYISGLGSYQVFLNGNKAGKDLLTPGWTNYRKRVQYQVYDVKNMLSPGKNAAGIMLGNVWWSGGLGWKGGEVYSEGPLRSVFQLEITYKNGKTDIIVSDSDWKAHLSPVIVNNLYHGETYDEHYEIPGWSTAGLDDTSWKNTEPVDMDSIQLSAQFAPEIRIIDTIQPVKLTEVAEGVYVYDLGTNMVGTEKIQFKVNKGDTIVMKFAELLHPDGTVAQENLRSAKATDIYIPSKDGQLNWQPGFTYHGYRYVQVEGLSTKPEINDFTGLRFYSSADMTGNFECSNEVLNTVWKNTVNGQKGNMESVPTDCPQRDERLGWTGDAQIFAPTACYNMDMAAFFNKWTRDITDSQHEEGYVFDVNPAIVVRGPAKAGWGDAISVVPWTIFKFYGDQRILEQNYNGIKRWVEYMRAKSKDHIYDWTPPGSKFEGYGDWIAVEKSPVKPISAAYYYYSTSLLSNIAFILGYTQDYNEYNNLKDSIFEAFNLRFFDVQKINYPGGTQTANLIPFSFGLTKNEFKDQVVKNIADDVLSKGKHPTTGFLGTSLLLPVLSDNNYHQLAYETSISKEYPSWGYMASQGATSIWELWNSDKEKPDAMNSRNHFALGSVSEWYFSHLGGIKTITPGFKEFSIAPMPAEGLEWVNCSYNSPYGKIVSNWSIDSKEFILDVSIPANSTATVTFPTSYIKRMWDTDNIIISETGVPVDPELPSEIKGIKSILNDEDHISFRLLSGKYHFSIKSKS